jgi:hypothetical protein
MSHNFNQPERLKTLNFRSKADAGNPLADHLNAFTILRNLQPNERRIFPYKSTHAVLRIADCSPSCSVPECEGVSLTFREERWPDIPRERHDHARHPRRNTAIEGSALKGLAAHSGRNRKTVVKWRATMGPKVPRSTESTASRSPIIPGPTVKSNGRTEHSKKLPSGSYHHNSHHQFGECLKLSFDAHSFAKRLKTLRGLTPYEAICKAWAEGSNRFTSDPIHLTSGQSN